MDILWLVWWASLATVQFIPWYSQSVEASGKLSWATLALAGACLSLCEKEPKREITFGIGALVLLLIFLFQISVVIPSVKWVEWSRAWGTVAAFGSLACWLIAIVWGTRSVTLYSPAVHESILPIAILTVICVNFVFLALKFVFGIKWWYWAFDTAGGMFPNRIVWGGFCAVALPFLMAWKPLAAVPALAGVVSGQSSCSYAALFCGLAWFFKGERKRLLLVGLTAAGLLLIRFALPHGDLEFNNLMIRAHTWKVILKTIISHPFGIGFSLNAYSNAIGVPPYKILPHPASDVLRCVLELGWGMVPLFAWIAYRSRKLGRDGLSISLIVAGALSCIQSSMIYCSIGVLFWGIWMAWRIRESGVSVKYGKSSSAMLDREVKSVYERRSQR